MQRKNPSQLAEYTENIFDITVLEQEISLPLEDEGFVECWSEWEADARRVGAIPALAAHLPQLRFPVREGMSANEGYRAAMRTGASVDEIDEATGLELEHPELVELRIHQAAAGKVPVLIARGRAELVTLIQALAARNEPRAIPPAQGASMISGLINWTRVRKLQQAWSAIPPEQRDTATWPEEMARISKEPALFRDRLIILGDGPYSGVEAGELGLDEATWKDLSLEIRLHHESTHYLTRRLLGAMRNNLLDELMADYTGLVAASGRFRADWFLRFLGVERSGERVPGGRVGIYRGDPPLDDDAFAGLQRMMVRVADQVEAFDRAEWPAGERRGTEDQTMAVLAIARLGLGEMAQEGGSVRLRECMELVGRNVRWRSAH